ncbi:MAG: RNA polymerase sigma factor [Deltaproteobacteria bacterium]|nr:RNA polymerase sigma factor [Deltaproteobacteria bacterium]
MEDVLINKNREYPGVELLEDHEIMVSVKDGDVHKLGLLFDRHAQGLFNYFQLQVRDRFRSEDLVQNVFYKILKYRHTFKEGADFRVWMYAIARNEKVNFFKHNRSSDEEVNPEQPDENSNNPENDLASKTDKKHLGRALERISPDSRELLILSKYTGLPYNRIAEIYDCTVGAIKVRIFRAMQELKAQFVNIAEE